MAGGKFIVDLNTQMALDNNPILYIYNVPIPLKIGSVLKLNHNIYFFFIIMIVTTLCMYDCIILTM
jgi:hypothetical protein